MTESGQVRTLARGAGVSIAGRFLSQGLNLAAQVVLAQQLGPRAFGLYAIGLTLIRLAGRFTSLGLPKGVIRFGARHHAADPGQLKGVLVRSLGLSALSGASFGVALFFAAPWLAETVFDKPELTAVIRWFSPLSLLFVCLQVASAATTISKSMKYQALSRDVAQPVVNLVLIFAFHLLGFGLLGAIQAGVISFVVAVLLAFGFLLHLFPKVWSHRSGSEVSVRELMAFSLPALLAGTFGMLNIRVVRILMGGLASAAEVGIFQAASQIPLLFPLIGGAFSAILLPMIADLTARGEDLRRLDSLYKVGTKWAIYLSAPWFLVMCVAPREIMSTTFGAAYESGWLAMVILAVGQMVNVSVGAVGPLLTMSGHPKTWMAVTLPGLIGTVVLTFLLVPGHGTTGAALAVTASMAAVFPIGVLRVRRTIGVFPWDRRFLKGILAAVLSLGGLLIVTLWWSPGGALTLVASAIVANLVFFGALLAFGLDAEDREFRALVFGRLKRIGRS